MYRYNTVQLPPKLSVKQNTGIEAAQFLQRVITQYTTGEWSGWEYHSMETIHIRESGCCLMFQQESTTTYYVAIFKKWVEESPRQSH